MQQNEDQFTTNQSINLLQETLFAQQQQVQALQEQFVELSRANKTLVHEVHSLQKIVETQRQSQHELLNFLQSPDDRWRNGSNNRFPNQANHMNGASMDDQAPELRRARELLTSVTTNSMMDRELERLNGLYAQSSPPDSASSLMFQPGTMQPMLAEHVNMRHLVYPVGENVGIDPLSQDHFNNIPYTLNSLPAAINDYQQQPAVVKAEPTTPAQANQPRPQQPNQDTSLWGAKKPRVYLVEDDRTCSRIGSKFLTQMECTVELAVCVLVQCVTRWALTNHLGKRYRRCQQV